MASSNTITCPPPFVSDADYQRGGGYVHGRFCGINPGVPGQKCCLPCPVQDWVYPEEFTDKLKIANYVGISSVALCGFLLLSFLVLPPERSNRHYLTIGVTLAITFFSIPFLIPLGTKPDMCYDKITPNGQGSDISCAWTGALLLLGAMGSALWIFLRALWLHLRVCWEVDLGRPFMIISTAAGLAIPAAFTAVALTITGVSYRVGLVCLPNHRRAIVTFWAWEVGFAGAALLVQGATTGYCMWVYLLVLFRGRKRVAGAREAGTGQISANGRRPPDHSSFANESTSSSGSARPQNTWRKMRRMLLMQWRGIALTVIMAVESLFYIIVFVAQDTRFGEVASKANEPDARTWSACLVLTGGNRSACLIYAGKLAISQDLVLGSLLLGSLIGTQNFFLLARTGMFIGWWELLCRPFKRLHLFRHGGSDLPLTSLKPSDGQALPTSTNPVARDNHDYAISGTTPLMMSTNTSPSKPSVFSGVRRQRSTSRHSSSASSSLHDLDIPPVTVNNPYKLSLPSERAASLIDPAERARLARTGEIVDLHGLYARGVHKDSAAFNDARPSTPPPPPLPLNAIHRSPIQPGPPPPPPPPPTGSPFEAGTAGTGAAGPYSLAAAAAPLSFPTHPPPHPSATLQHYTKTIPSPSRSPTHSRSHSRSSTPFSSSHTAYARAHPSSLSPCPSHTPDFLHAAAASNSATGPGIANRHRLPSWARSSTHAGSEGGEGGGGEGGVMATASELRDAMRGGLALHPVDMAEFGELGGGGGSDWVSRDVGPVGRAAGEEVLGGDTGETERVFSSSGSEEVVDGRRESRGEERE